MEVAPLGIKVTLVEPGPYSTDWSTASAARSERIAAYDGVYAARGESRKNWVSGDPEATGPAILKVVDAAEPPLRVFFGSSDHDLGSVERRRARGAGFRAGVRGRARGEGERAAEAPARSCT
jgi:NAD(P)-dependent dehydrogenase (short-subunit alcohol dehydrogenase family)